MYTIHNYFFKDKDTNLTRTKLAFSVWDSMILNKLGYSATFLA